MIVCRPDGYQVVVYVLDILQIIIYKTCSCTERPFPEFALNLRLITDSFELDFDLL